MYLRVHKNFNSLQIQQHEWSIRDTLVKVFDIIVRIHLPDEDIRASTVSVYFWTGSSCLYLGIQYGCLLRLHDTRSMRGTLNMILFDYALANKNGLMLCN